MPVGAIVGTVLGGIALLLGVAVGVFCFCRRRKRRRATPVEVGSANGGHKSGFDSRGKRSEHGDRGGDGAFLAQPMLSPTTTIFPLRLLGSEAMYNLLGSASNVPWGPDNTHTSFQTAASAALVSLPTANRPSKRHAELTQRLETLQRRRSVLSHQASSRCTRSEASNENGTEAAMRELEAEIAQLRGLLSAFTLNVREADGGHGGRLEPLPAYAE